MTARRKEDSDPSHAKCIIASHRKLLSTYIQQTGRPAEQSNNILTPSASLDLIRDKNLSTVM